MPLLCMFNYHKGEYDDSGRTRTTCLINLVTESKKDGKEAFLQGAHHLIHTKPPRPGIMGPAAISPPRGMSAVYYNYLAYIR